MLSLHCTAELLVARRGAAALPRSQCVKVRQSRLPITQCAHAVYSKQWRPALASMIAIFPLHALAEYFACQAAMKCLKEDTSQPILTLRMSCSLQYRAFFNFYECFIKEDITVLMLVLV